MRLTKIKLAGFKSFVDPTKSASPAISPASWGRTVAASQTSSTLCVGSWASCRPSTFAARTWRMWCSTAPPRASPWARPPWSSCSTTRWQDRRRFANYNDISLKRQVSRDGSSGYFINSARCRRKDITNLFLGTGPRLAQLRDHRAGHDSRVIEAKSDDIARLHRGGRRDLPL